MTYHSLWLYLSQETLPKIPDPFHGIPLPKDLAEEECQCPATHDGLFQGTIVL